jgi:hypothetical protein
MRCLFCKRDSSASVSEEHIVPESLGNKSLTLPPGVVCDRCNNYFSREVEKPFLDSEHIKSLRFEQALPSKKGKIPQISGIVVPVMSPILVTRYVSGPLFASGAVPEDALHEISKLRSGRLIFPATQNVPTGMVVSRFLAKVAVEVMASRLVRYPEGLEYLAGEKQLDLIRDHARIGTTPIWPYTQRIIYDRNKQWTDLAGNPTQVIHEEDVLKTEWGEWFLVFALFGTEFAINYGGPEIEGYKRWLAEHHDISPLYAPKTRI